VVAGTPEVEEQTMSNPGQTQVFGKEGLHGFLLHGGTSSAEREVLVRFDNGTEVLVGRDVLQRQDDGSYYLPMSVAELAAYHTPAPATGDERIVVPLVAEELQVGKRLVESGRVRLRTVVTERQETVDVALMREEIDVERIEIGTFVDQAPVVRREDGVLIIPLLEEVLVVEKRLRLTAEIRVQLRKTTVREPQQVTLRREEIAVDRVTTESPHEAVADR
jgi:uncharacterized protein (TIGR02271 family)